MEENKKTYSKPELTIHGNVEEITLSASSKNTDVPNGNDGTAFPPGS